MKRHCCSQFLCEFLSLLSAGAGLLVSGLPRDFFLLGTASLRIGVSLPRRALPSGPTDLPNGVLIKRLASFGRADAT